ncbi:DUF1489 family protein [Sphingomonas canadensis]|uniref:DUF1489 family protein n=1 Tax=Sphingomonas canadensis TaxID=1219257 RepID=A0ABW3H275_9SPHN|nr:DUF1489 domain-containing protein [Sphingomonas canadensis]MCW3834868.1 DUF1489 domain-containing protein [Sphingomonas canadensis]
MPLHLTKVAFGCDSLAYLAERLAARQGPVELTTRYLPKRHEEIVEGGSLFWILKHQLVARSPILGFGEAEGGKTAIRIAPHAIPVQARPKRAHQGWRYLEGADAPPDLLSASGGISEMPPELAGKLAGMGLI